MMRRRGLIAAGSAFVLGILGLRRVTRAAQVFPPSASEDFEARCIRCLRCAEACPVDAITVGAKFVVPGSELPVIEAQTRACILCMKCTEVCPTGALSPLSAELVDIRENVKMGLAVLDRTACLTHSRKAQCRLCYEVCPLSGEAIILSGLGQGPAIMASACVGCGRCAEACPTRARAITILPLRGPRT